MPTQPITQAGPDFARATIPYTHPGNVPLGGVEVRLYIDGEGTAVTPGQAGRVTLAAHYPDATRSDVLLDLPAEGGTATNVRSLVLAALAGVIA